ncbi:DUF1801 domain-containing protein [Sinobaca sp. H24]|uniref:DUF1801 domain-containing protein n=1 Tax=Sinobaca sp. H24 TaxID=2923376 RepID=UPI002079C990|nr:DUF1801 domain-containing protein [Sinobaca sp. H24]
MSEVEQYVENIEEKWKDSFPALLKVIDQHIPPGFELKIQYGMPSYVVPLTLYPEGYHVDKNTPLPFISLAAQKNYISVYHMGIYADQKLLEWFQNEYPSHMSAKLNMGKSCIRFTNPKNIPYQLMGELASKMTCEEWIKKYEGE